jgi:hypothetical protein
MVVRRLPPSRLPRPTLWQPSNDLRLLLSSFVTNGGGVNLEGLGIGFGTGSSGQNGFGFGFGNNSSLGSHTFNGFGSLEGYEGSGGNGGGSGGGGGGGGTVQGFAAGLSLPSAVRLRQRLQLPNVGTNIKASFSGAVSTAASTVSKYSISVITHTLTHTHTHTVH